MYGDARSMHALHRAASRTRLRRIVTRFIATYLPTLMIIGFAVALYVSHTLTIAQELAAFFFSLAAGVVSRFIIGSLIRGLVRRPRPYVTHGLKPLIPLRSYSFPSAHALFFFAFSVVVYAAIPALGMLYLILTVCVCIARIAAGIHYPSDMIAGAAIGVATALLMLAYSAPLLGISFALI